jgi:hypothetical protein
MSRKSTISVSAFTLSSASLRGKPGMEEECVTRLCRFRINSAESLKVCSSRAKDGARGLSLWLGLS